MLGGASGKKPVVNKGNSDKKANSNQINVGVHFIFIEQKLV